MPQETIHLRLINRSAEAMPPEVAVWQCNDVPGGASTAVIWKVIRRCWRDWEHPFDLPGRLRMLLRDSAGARLWAPAHVGAQIRALAGESGVLRLETARATDPSTFEIRNLSLRSALTAEIWRGDRVLAVQRGIAVGATVPFRFRPSLWLSAVSRLEEGAPLNGGMWLGFPVELDLFGFVSTDIVMTGGGPGPRSTPLTFQLTGGRTWPV